MVSCPSYKLARANVSLITKLYAGMDNDYSVDTMEVKVENERENAVEFRFHSDSVAQERNETFTLQLAVAEGSTLPDGDGVFFVDEMNMVIVDIDGKTDGKRFFFNCD